MTILCTQFINQIRNLNLFGRSDKLLLAVSGGLDSMVLAELCTEAGYQYQIAHANFQLREEESDGDEKFVRDFANSRGIRLHLKKFETKKAAADLGIGIQPVARQLRYDWFAELLISEDLKYIVTAHHRDDNIETAIFNFFRGTGIKGVRGILPQQNNIVRPLLNFSKAELRYYAELRGLHWREDSSNQSDKYSRNFIRNQLLPNIGLAIPEAEKNIAGNIERFREIEELYEQAITVYRKKLLKKNGETFQIPIEALRKVKPLNSVVYELCEPFGFSSGQTGEIIKLMDAEQGAYVLSTNNRIIRNRKWLIIASLLEPAPDFVVIDNDQTQAAMPAPFHALNIQRFQREKVNLNSDLFTAFVNSDELEYPLIFRKWKTGDYFYPLGMKKKKKLSRFLIDQKMSTVEKENVYVLQSGKRICWVVGLRLDDRFRVGDTSQQITKFTIHQLRK